jgi:hypothetical protein
MRSHRPTSILRRGVFLAILSGVFLISGCKPTELSTPTTDETGVPDDAAAFKPQPVINIERIQPFRLEQSFQFDWRRDRPDVRSGLLVVVRVNPELVVPTNQLEPVLYAGNQTVQRLNLGHESGFVIGIIPEQIDLSQHPVWFGTPALPERIDADRIAAERARAERAGIKPRAASDIQSLTLDPIDAPDLSTLLREHAADLLLEFSPQEKPLADAWRLPVTGS